MRVLFITDSLSFPMKSGDSVFYSSTYFAKISSDSSFTGFDFCFFCKHGLSLTEVVESYESVISLYQADLIVFQCGIVDCFPRALTRKELAIVSRLPVLGPLIHRFIKRYYQKILQYRDISYLDYEQLRQAFEAIRDGFSERTLFIEVAPCSFTLNKVTPLLTRNVLRTNQIMNEMFGENNVVSMSDMNADTHYASDGYHLSNSGHLAIYSKLRKKFEEFI